MKKIISIAVIMLVGCGGAVNEPGPPGTNGANGSPGMNGTNGADGQPGNSGSIGVQGATGNSGAQGDAGSSGLNSLIVEVPISGGSTMCLYGGIEIESGLDFNSNGVLDPNEVTSTAYVCNGTRELPPAHFCTPGQQINCGCTGGYIGYQVCNPAGSSYGLCSCEGGGTVPPLCIPGQRISCACDERDGYQICDSSGKPGSPCYCEASPDAG